MTKVALLLFVLSIIFLPKHSLAEIYKCKNEAAQLIFSDKPCGDQSELVKIKKHKKPSTPANRPFHCSSGIVAVVNNLHYPTLEDVDEAIRLAESDYASLRYRKLIKKVDPADKLPDRVSKIRAEAFLASDVPGFSNGVVVNVRICK